MLLFTVANLDHQSSSKQQDNSCTWQSGWSKVTLINDWPSFWPSPDVDVFNMATLHHCALGDTGRRNRHCMRKYLTHEIMCFVHAVTFSQNISCFFVFSTFTLHQSHNYYDAQADYPAHPTAFNQIKVYSAQKLTLNNLCQSLSLI